jgi:transcriptional regulator with XRE-family HTH domain
MPSMKEAVIFGKNLEALRKKRGITQARLSEALGISLPHYYYLRSGKRAPSWALLLKIRQVLKCKLSDLTKGV